MGTKFFQSPKASAFKPAGVNLTARAGGAGSYSARAAGAGASKSLGAAQAMAKYMKLKPGVRGSAYAPGPKKV